MPTIREYAYDVLRRVDVRMPPRDRTDFRQVSFLLMDIAEALEAGYSVETLRIRIASGQVHPSSLTGGQCQDTQQAKR